MQAILKMMRNYLEIHGKNLDVSWESPGTLLVQKNINPVRVVNHALGSLLFHGQLKRLLGLLSTCDCTCYCGCVECVH